MLRSLTFPAIVALIAGLGTLPAFAASPPAAPTKNAVAACNPQKAQAGSRDKRLKDLEDQLARDGRAAAKAFDCGNVYLLVKSGNARAVGLAVKLLRYSDAVQTQHLYDALATAMAKHPETILAHFRDVPRASAPQFCVPFISAATSRRTAFNALKRTDDALAHVTRADLQ
ncbi:MAG TPA: hypothetical protein VNH44_18800, partial [Micropepsaceae bacterium]|nr:hypothetical protein [Micropepsaceae bacterium]